MMVVRPLVAQELLNRPDIISVLDQVLRLARRIWREDSAVLVYQGWSGSWARGPGGCRKASGLLRSRGWRRGPGPGGLWGFLSRGSRRRRAAVVVGVEGDDGATVG